MKKLMILLLALTFTAYSENVLIEAEGFKNPGGWQLDTQFIHSMGSPYMMAHGLGKPVEDASSTFEIKKAGKYKVWVRTKDWVAHWKAPGTPGKFNVLVNGKKLGSEFGVEGAEWHWQDGGVIELNAGENKIGLHDLTGFNGRCDAVYLTSDLEEKPENSNEVLSEWRKNKLGHAARVTDKGGYDLVVVGGGYGGLGAAISAARMGLKVALIQNRDVLGGNGSSEVMVWAQGKFPNSEYKLKDIILEFRDYAKASPGYIEEFGDDKKEKLVRAEKNIDLFLGHHAFGVNKSGRKIDSVDVMNVRTNEVLRFKSKFFSDSTGHGVVLELAGAEGTLKEKGRMGMSNMWRWKTTDKEVKFPATPWALELGEGEFPYPKKNHAQWFWESGFDKHPYNDLELIRDWNLRANFGAWNAIKNKEAYYRYDKSGAKHAKADLMWMAYVGGTRETKQYYGDILVEEKDVVGQKAYPDSCVLATWSIDLHYPKKQYLGKFKENPFISYAVHGKGVDRKKGYAFPYRSFYSKNFDNLYIACRALSVTHEALGTIRVMNTLGMVGVAVGRACHVAVKHNTTARGVYEKHLEEAKELWRLPGKARKELK